MLRKAEELLVDTLGRQTKPRRGRERAPPRTVSEGVRSPSVMLFNLVRFIFFSV